MGDIEGARKTESEEIFSKASCACSRRKQKKKKEEEEKTKGSNDGATKRYVEKKRMQPKRETAKKSY